jgi:hypothetical protein
MYFYAAAVIFFFLSVAYVLQQRSEKPVSEVMSIKPKSHTANPEILPQVERAEESLDSPISRATKIETNQIVVPERNELVIEVPDDPQNETILTQVLVEESDPVQDSKIEPIIGRYDPLQRTEAVTGAKRRRQLHKLETSEIKSGADYKNAILIARIK